MGQALTPSPAQQAHQDAWAGEPNADLVESCPAYRDALIAELLKMSSSIRAQLKGQQHINQVFAYGMADCPDPTGTDYLESGDFYYV